MGDNNYLDPNQNIDITQQIQRPASVQPSVLTTNLVNGKEQPYNPTRMMNLLASTQSPSLTGVPMDKRGEAAVQYTNEDFYPTRIMPVTQQGNSLGPTISATAPLIPFAAMAKMNQEREMKKSMMEEASRIDYAPPALNQIKANEQFRNAYVRDLTGIVAELKGSGLTPYQIANNPKLKLYQQAQADFATRYNDIYKRSSEILNAKDDFTSSDAKNAAREVLFHTNKALSDGIGYGDRMKSIEAINNLDKNLQKAKDAQEGLTETTKMLNEAVNEMDVIQAAKTFEGKSLNSSDEKLYATNTFKGTFLKPVIDQNGNIKEYAFNEDEAKNALALAWENRYGVEVMKDENGNSIQKNGKYLYNKDNTFYNDDRKLIPELETWVDLGVKGLKKGVMNTKLTTVNTYARDYYKENNRKKELEVTVPVKEGTEIQIGDKTYGVIKGVDYTPDKPQQLIPGTVLTRKSDGAKLPVGNASSYYNIGLMKLDDGTVRAAYVGIKPTYSYEQGNVDATGQKLPDVDNNGQTIIIATPDINGETYIGSASDVKSSFGTMKVGGKNLKLKKEDEADFFGNVKTYGESNKETKTTPTKTTKTTTVKKKAY